MIIVYKLFLLSLLFLFGSDSLSSIYAEDSVAVKVTTDSFVKPDDSRQLGDEPAAADSQLPAFSAEQPEDLGVDKESGDQVIPEGEPVKIVNNVKVDVAGSHGTLTPEQFKEFCAIMGKSIKDGLNPPKVESPLYKRMLLWALKAPYTLFTHLPAEIRCISYIYFLMKYRPDWALSLLGKLGWFVAQAGSQVAVNAMDSVTTDVVQNFVGPIDFNYLALALNSTGWF